MHYQRMFSKNGEGFQETLRMLQRTGAALTNEQMEASKEYTRLTATVGLVGQGMQNYFLEGFMNAIPKDESWLDNVKMLDKVAKDLGEEMGKLTVNTAKTATMFLNIFTGLDSFMRENFGFIYAATGKDASVWDMANRTFNPFAAVSDGLTSKNDEGVSIWDKVVGYFEKDGSGSAANNYTFTGESIRQDAQNFQSKAMQYQTNPTFNITLTPEVALTLQSDVSRLSDYIDFNAKASSDSFMQSLTLQTLSGQSNSN